MPAKTVLVTGGSGFIGTNVVAELLNRGYRVLVLDHSLKSSSEWRHRDLPTVEVMLGDITKEKDVFEAMSHADAFIHLAGVLGTQETIQNPSPALMTNLTGGLNVLEAASRYGIPGVNIAVGNYWENNPYSISKNMVERLVSMFNLYRGTNIAVVRALNAYGPGQSVAAPYGNSKVRKIVPSFVARALHGDPIEVYGDGTQVMDMIHVADVADCLVSAVEYVLDHPEVNNDLITSFEAGTGVPTTVNDVAHAVLYALGDRTTSEYRTLPMRAGETASRPVLADTSTLKPLAPYLSTAPENFENLMDGIRGTVAYYERQFRV